MTHIAIDSVSVCCMRLPFFDSLWCTLVNKAVCSLRNWVLVPVFIVWLCGSTSSETVVTSAVLVLDSTISKRIWPHVCNWCVVTVCTGGGTKQESVQKLQLVRMFQMRLEFLKGSLTLVNLPQGRPRGPTCSHYSVEKCCRRLPGSVSQIQRDWVEIPCHH